MKEGLLGPAMSETFFRSYSWKLLQGRKTCKKSSFTLIAYGAWGPYLIKDKKLPLKPSRTY